MSQRELDLDGALADLAASLEFPPTPDLAAAVAAQLDQAPDRAPATARPWLRSWRRLTGLVGWRRLAVAGMAAVLLAAAVLVASPGTREAVARRLGLRGIDIRIGGPPPTTATTRRTDRLELGLGQRVTLEEARRRVGFPVLVPGAGDLGPPDAVFLGQLPEGGRVDLVYRARPGLPASPFTDVGLLVTQFRGQPTPEFLKKVTGMGLVEEVTVGGEPGYWFSGEPHFFTYQDAAGNLREERTRLAGNTLIWQRGELTLRLEGEIPKEEAIRIAESMR
jgi:Domain of unknown function (DUF4367)